jgi:NAD(P)-dependent dehydrogenase (short-subunit alcohol dehydrogenase family)
MKASELFDVAGLAVIVTGAASGIGYAYADAMADNGARVVLVDIDRAGLDQAVAKLKTSGGDVRGAVADVTDRGALRAAFDRAAGELGRLDVLFANAGIDSGPGFLVNAIAPGPFITNIAGGHMRDPEIAKAFGSAVPLNRVASTDEIQGAALFLASRASTFVTGAELVIDGGVMLGRAD